ncbi:integrin alpha-IIb-like [Ascaphus truei]|uniref:integrin alpha-IIb-like n=1 Tax=Ascaphus truei TaxID=8439 RepID=UPI003F5A87D6
MVYPPTLTMGQWLLLLLLPVSAQALNLDEKNPTVFSGPNGSYFGFSLDFYQAANGGMNIVVGAPKLQTSQPGVTEGGGVFLCPWRSRGGSCTDVPFDGTGDQTVVGETHTTTISKSHQWFGASVRAWKTDIVACAPLQHWIFTDSGQGSGLTPTGACYITSEQQKVRDFAPCRDMKTENHYNSSSYLYDKRYCEIGFSTDIASDGTLLAGGPGGYFFSGLFTAIKMSSIPSASHSLLRSYPNLQLSAEVQAKYDDAYRGFSVATGEFTGDSTPEYVVGCPNYLGTLGLVEIHSSIKNTINLYSFSGEQVASYFGHTVAVADVNNDGMDDVLVGAPLFMEWRTGGRLQEVGRVYVYLQRRVGRFNDEPQILSGSRAYGQFGASIAPLGDLDQDGFPDVAVGSPFGGTNGSGCVHIFRGGSTGLLPHPSQVLESPLPPPSRLAFH